jgi:hypothetical protein
MSAFGGKADIAQRGGSMNAPPARERAERQMNHPPRVKLDISRTRAHHYRTGKYADVYLTGIRFSKWTKRKSP